MTSDKKVKRVEVCTFCSRRQDDPEVFTLIKSPKRGKRYTYICNFCVLISLDVVCKHAKPETMLMLLEDILTQRRIQAAQKQEGRDEG